MAAALFASLPAWAGPAILALFVLDRVLRRVVGLIEHLTALRGTTPEQRPPILEQLKQSKRRKKSVRLSILPKEDAKRDRKRRP